MRALLASGLAPGAPVGADDLRTLYAFPEETWVRANFVATVDGSAQGADDLSGSINTGADREVFAVNRRLADCVLVGAGTARAEHYGPARLPLIVVSRAGHVPQSLLGDREGRVVLATCAAAGREPDADLWVCGDEEVDLAAVVARCAKEGMPRILAEGGPHLFGSLLEAGLVDEVALTTSPRIAGGDHLRVVASAADLELDLELGHLLEQDGTLLALWRITR